MNKSVFYQRMVSFFPMPQKLKDLCLKSEQFFWYIVVGVTITILNGLVYWIGIRCGVSNVVSTVIAWIIAVIAAFFANKLIVFASKRMSFLFVLKEMALFVGCRLGSGFVDVGIMYVSVDLWGWNGLLMKLISDFIVTLINFFASKFLIFRKKKT